MDFMFKGAMTTLAGRGNALRMLTAMLDPQAMPWDMSQQLYLNYNCHLCPTPAPNLVACCWHKLCTARQTSCCSTT